MRISAYFFLTLLFAAFPLHAQETADPTVFSQEEYNQKVAREMEEINQALQAMSKFMVKSMNNMTDAINKSAPGIAKSMGDLIKSMEPIIKAAQQEQDSTTQVREAPVPAITSRPASAINDTEVKIRQNKNGNASTAEPPAKRQAAPETPAKPQINQVYRPKRIQLFPAPQPNHD